MYLCMYITAFASISSMALEIEALSFTVNWFRKKTKERSEHKVWCGTLKTKSTTKLSNFYFQWGKTLYQDNLTNIAFFFTFFKGLRCNNKSSVVTPKKIFHGRQRKWMSNFTRYVISIGNHMISSAIWNK